MALSRVKVWGNEILYPTDLNAEFQNIIDNASSLISPLSGSLDWDGYAHTLDAAGVTTAQSTAATGWSFTPGSKSGTPSTTGGVANWVANTYTDTSTAASGTATAWTGHSFQRPTLAASNASVTTTDAATVYIANAPLAGSNETITNAWSLWVDNGNSRFDGNIQASGNATVTGDLAVAANLRGTAALGGHIQGLTYANSAGDPTNDIDIAIGMCTSADAAQANRRTLVLTSALTKQLDASWAVGTSAGGLDTGVIGNSDYYIWLIMRSDTGVVDALFSLSSTAPTMPTNYDYKRLIGWFKRVAGTIVSFHAYETAGGGIELLWDSPTLDINLSNTLTTSRRTDAVKVPLNFSTVALLNVNPSDSGSSHILYMSCPDLTDLAPSVSAAPLITFNANAVAISNSTGGMLRIRTSATGTIAARSNLATVDLYAVATLGFQWARRN